MLFIRACTVDPLDKGVPEASLTCPYITWGALGSASMGVGAFLTDIRNRANTDSTAAHIVSRLIKAHHIGASRFSYESVITFLVSVATRFLFIQLKPT